MTNTEEWLRQIADEPNREPNCTPDEWLAIRDEINERKFDDHALIPECLTESLRVLGDIGTGNSANPARDATQCLRRLLNRAHTGAPFGEPGDDWPDPRESLIDREPGLRHGRYIRRVETVVEDL